MDVLTPLASAAGLGLLAGARLYLTVFAIGLLIRFEWIALPAAWQQASVLADTRLLIISGVACAIEFVADKIPWLDSAWDSLHTFIRPVGAALAATSLFSNLEPVYQVSLFLLAGGVAFSGHSAKAATRLAANHSPEPFSNIALSLGEDLLVAGGLYLWVKHPWVMAAVALCFLAIFAWLAPRLYRSIRAQWAAFAALLRRWTGAPREVKLTPALERRFLEYSSGRPPRAIFDAIATADLKGLRNAIGTLCLSADKALFFSRKWGRAVEREIAPVASLESRTHFLLDELAIVAADGRKVRFDLLAGQRTQAAAVTSPS
jgi:Domain of unknown function (DUF4126)